MANANVRLKDIAMRAINILINIITANKTKNPDENAPKETQPIEQFFGHQGFFTHVI